MTQPRKPNQMCLFLWQVFGVFSPVAPRIGPDKFFGVGKSFFFTCKPKYEVWKQLKGILFAFNAVVSQFCFTTLSIRHKLTLVSRVSTCLWLFSCIVFDLPSAVYNIYVNQFFCFVFFIRIYLPRYDKKFISISEQSRKECSITFVCQQFFLVLRVIQQMIVICWETGEFLIGFC